LDFEIESQINQKRLGERKRTVKATVRRGQEGIPYCPQTILPFPIAQSCIHLEGGLNSSKPGGGNKLNGLGLLRKYFLNSTPVSYRNFALVNAGLAPLKKTDNQISI
jgi:hypothetical protein